MPMLCDLCNIRSVTDLLSPVRESIFLHKLLDRTESFTCKSDGLHAVFMDITRIVWTVNNNNNTLMKKILRFALRCALTTTIPAAAKS